MKKITFGHLKQLQLEIASSDSFRAKRAFDTLLGIEMKGEPVGLKMFFSYLKGEFYSLKADSEQPLENYFKAHQCYKEVFTIAKSIPVRVKFFEYHYQYAYSAYQLSKWTSFLPERDRLIALAIEVTEDALKWWFPNNTSLKKLHKNLKEYSASLA